MNYKKRVLIVMMLLALGMPMKGQGIYPFFQDRASLSQLIVCSSIGLLFVSVSYMIVTVTDAIRIDIEEKRAAMLTQLRQRGTDSILDTDTIERK